MNHSRSFQRSSYNRCIRWRLLSVSQRTRIAPTQMSHIPRILVAGLGNLPHPGTRHRQVFTLVPLLFQADFWLRSVGQLIIDELAWRTGIKMSSERDGLMGESTVCIGDTPIMLMLYKSSELPVDSLPLRYTHIYL